MSFFFGRRPSMRIEHMILLFQRQNGTYDTLPYDIQLQDKKNEYD